MKKTLVILALSIVAAFADTQKIGTFEIAQPIFRALKGAVNGSAYLTIAQTDDTGDKLIRAECDASERMEIHDHITDPSTHAKKMVEIKDVSIPGKKEDCNFFTCWLSKTKPVSFVKGGKHLMLMGLKPGASDLKEVNIKLVFEKAGEVKVKFIAENNLAESKDCECNHNEHKRDDGCKHGDCKKEDCKKGDCKNTGHKH